jgi:4-aminobutyrate aminotransferase/(S)-3-amino-2-methylpropionate transaminase
MQMATIRILTEIPGPRSRAVMARRASAVNRSTKEPATNEAIDIVRLACERGVILIPAGTFGNVIRFLMPLTITDEELDEGLDVLARCVEAAGRPEIAAFT